jgi:TRAP transporter TAXI family solute receptor
MTLLRRISFFYIYTNAINYLFFIDFSIKIDFNIVYSNKKRGYMTLKSYTKFFFKFMLVGALLFSSSAFAKELRIGTASQGGAFYPVGQAISNLVNKHADGLTMVPVVTQGSVQNPKLVSKGEVNLGITNNNLAVFANKGAAMYKKNGKMNLRALGALHFSVLHMMTTANSKIKTISDLKGKRIACGPAGGGTIPMMTQVLALHGLTMKDIKPTFLSYADGFKQLADGNVDAAFALSGYPAGAATQVIVTTKLKHLKMAPGKMDAALAKYKNYNLVNIPKSAYKTLSTGEVLGVNNMLVVDASMSNDTAYKITKAVYGNMKEFKENNSYANQIIPENSLKLKIPLHPGSEKYFKK